MDVGFHVILAILWILRGPKRVKSFFPRKMGFGSLGQKIKMGMVVGRIRQKVVWEVEFRHCLGWKLGFLPSGP